MPPQRRKIVPPNTTSKARKKVAGTGRKPEADTPHPKVETDDTVAPDRDVQSTDVQAPDVQDTDVDDVQAPDESDEQTKVSLDKEPVASAAPAATVAPASNTSPTVGDAGRTNWVPAIVVGAIAVLLIAFAAVAAFAPGTDVDNEAWVDQGASSEVTRAAEEGITALYRYNYETIDEDLARAREMMGPDMQADTDVFLEQIKSNARQSLTATDVDVMDIGLVRLESDRAELLTNVNVSSTRGGVAYGNQIFPLIVNMEKLDGKWVVSSTQDR